MNGSTLLVFILALAGLLASAQFFTSAAEKVGHYLKLPPFVIGVFIIGIGTSLPELVSAIFAVNKGVSEIIPGNVFGANVSNIFLVLGVVAALSRSGIELSSRYIMIDLHYMLGTALLLLFVAYDGQIRWTEGLVLSAAFMIHSIYVLRSDSDHSGEKKEQKSFPAKEIGIMLLAGVGIYFSGEYTVSSLEKMALALAIPPSIVSLTILSFGTTLPELVVSLLLIRKNKSEEAVGNVLGSSIFNTTMIPAIASFVGTVTVPADLLSLPIYVFLGATVFFYLLTQDKKISSWEGMLFVLFYVAFILKTAHVI